VETGLKHFCTSTAFALFLPHAERWTAERYNG